MNQHIILAPHLDDEIIGCYSILHKVNKVIYFTKDYRSFNLYEKLDYVYYEDYNFDIIDDTDTIYLPSKFDFHPLHKIVRNKYINLPCKKLFYNVEMNVPWLEEEEDKMGKLYLLKKLYPNEDLFIKNDKYWIFKSIKPFDDIIFTTYYFKLGHKNYMLNWFDTNSTLFDIINIQNKENNTDLELYNNIQNLYPNAIIELSWILHNGKIIKTIK